MGAIGLNPIRLDRIGLDPIRINAIKLGVPGASSGSERPYIDPEVLASLKAVCICYGKSNDDPDRAVVKNLVDPDNPFVISNAAYDKMSGFGGYEFAKFTTWNINASSTQIINISDYSITFKKLIIDELKQPYCKILGVLNKELVLKCKSNKRLFLGWQLKYKTEEGGPDITLQIPLDSSDVIANNEMEFILPYKTKEELATLGAIESSVYYLVYFSNRYLAVGEEYTVEMLPLFEGAFVTDGIDDLITSTKTVQEMLGGSNEITVVSMIHQIADRGSTYPNIYNNQIRYSTRLLRSTVTAANVVGKTGIYGYTATGVSITGTPTGKVVNDILGDKNDYPYLASAFTGIDAESHFSVEGYLSDSGNINETSQVAWYWTFIANKVLTTDQINQVIAYFNLDRTLKPDILCNTIKQGITNENHAEFGDKLIDYSGNGRDIQLNNLAWKGGSGIAAKQYETFKDWTNTPYQTSTVTEIDEFTRIVESTTNAYWVSMINRTSDFDKVHDSISIVLYQDDMLLVHECKYKVGEDVTTKALYETLKSDVNTITLATIDKFTDIPEDAEIMSLGEWVNPKSNKGSVKITLLPSYKGGLLLDGVSDFGKVTGMPIYKDYTVIIDYERLKIGYIEDKGTPAILSKSYTAGKGAFLMNLIGSTGEHMNAYTFGNANSAIFNDLSKKIYYQSKYKMQGFDMTIGSGVDGDSLWLGVVRDNDSRFLNGAIYSLMSFPYSMSEFLIERQLKKHKLGTLYPDMVEFRPIVKSNLPYSSISYSVNPGEYISVDSMVTITVTLPNTSDKLMELSCNAISDISISGDNGVYEITGKVVKSPQKINLVISSYLTMLNNETLISNETLIKNE